MSKWVILYRIVFLALLQADTVIAHVDIIYEPTHVLCKHEYFLLTGQSFLKLLYYWWSWKTAPKVQFVLITSSQHNECMSWMIKLIFWMTQRDRNTRLNGFKVEAEYSLNYVDLWMNGQAWNPQICDDNYGLLLYSPRICKRVLF